MLALIWEMGGFGRLGWKETTKIVKGVNGEVFWAKGGLGWSGMDQWWGGGSWIGLWKGDFNLSGGWYVWVCWIIWGGLRLFFWYIQRMIWIIRAYGWWQLPKQRMGRI